LQAQRPALGDLVQVRAVVQFQALAEARREQGEGLVEGEAQVLDADHAEVTLRQQVGHRQGHASARGHGHAQVGGCVAQQVGQRVACRCLRQAVRVIQNQQGFGTQVGDFGQPAGQLVEVVGALAEEAGTAPGHYWSTAADRLGNGQALSQAQRIIMLVEGQPDHHAALRQPVAAPLGE